MKHPVRPEPKVTGAKRKGKGHKPIAQGIALGIVGIIIVITPCKGKSFDNHRRKNIKKCKVSAIVCAEGKIVSVALAEKH